MGLRQFKNNKTWHAYFRNSEGKQTSLSLKTSDRAIAEILYAEIMKNVRIDRRQKKLQKFLFGETLSLSSTVITDDITLHPRTRAVRVKLNSAERLASKYKPFSANTQRLWKSFLKHSKLVYFDEVTRDLAFAYLQRFKGGKTYNNNLSSLSAVFKLLEYDAKLCSNPFYGIPMRANTPEHQRSFSDGEINLILSNSDKNWHIACMIALYTGARKKDCFKLRWIDISGDVIRFVPSKTSAYRRAVQIPLHKDLKSYLSLLPHDSETLVPALSKNDYEYSFGDLLKRLGILSSSEGLVNFNSFRNSFISKAISLGINPKLLGGATGQIREAQTLVYNTSLISESSLNEISYH